MVPTEIKPVQCRTLVLRAPIAEPVRTSFGTMKDRPVVLVSITDADGFTGWGEVWCNFPSCGAEHRAHLVKTEIAPLLLGTAISTPGECFQQLTRSLHLLVNQTGEAGPVAQCIAGVDMALWDLYAQHCGYPLYQVLSNTTLDEAQRLPKPVPIYASGLNPHEPERMVTKKMSEGFKAFKLKVGFDDELDVRNARVIRQLIGSDMQLMVDANQAWDLARATKMVQSLAEFDLTWIEEPLPVDAPESDWQSLSAVSPSPLAGGENLRGNDTYEAIIRSGLLRYIQPDVAKWGGISGCFAVARSIRQAGLTYCPHWLGGGVGLVASAHLLAAVGGDGMLEVDSNPNPLRDELIADHSNNTFWQPGDLSGLGITLRDDTIAQFLVDEWVSG